MKVGTVILLCVAIAVVITYYYHRSHKPKYPTYPKIDGISGFEPKPAAPPPPMQQNIDWQLDQLLKENPYLQQNQSTPWFSVVIFASMTGMVLLMGFLAAGKGDYDNDNSTVSSSTHTAKKNSNDASSEIIHRPADPKWKNGASLAVCMTLVLDDEEYGLRFGIWALLHILTERKIPATVFTTAKTLARSPDALAAMQEAGWEIAQLYHINRGKTQPRKQTPSSSSSAHLAACREEAAALEQLTLSAPKGVMVLGAGSHTVCSAIMAAGLFAYDASPLGDLPFFANPLSSKPHLAVPSAPAPLHSAYLQLRSARNPLSDAKSELLHAAQDSLAALPPFSSLHAPVFHCTPEAKVSVLLELRCFERFRQEPSCASRSLDKSWLCTRSAVAAHWCAAHPAPGPQQTMKESAGERNKN